MMRCLRQIQDLPQQDMHLQTLINGRNFQNYLGHADVFRGMCRKYRWWYESIKTCHYVKDSEEMKLKKNKKKAVANGLFSYLSVIYETSLSFFEVI